jgi:branched-chain amino acid transport system permease protein
VNWPQIVITGLSTGALYALFACGLSLLFGTMGVINLAHGDLAVVAAYAVIALLPIVGAANTYAPGALPTVIAFALVVPLFFVIGYAGQRLLIQPSLDRGPMTTLLVSFGLSVVIQNALLVNFSADSHSLDLGTFVASSIRFSPGVTVGYLSVAILILAVAVLGSLQLFLFYTPLGRQIRAVADDPEAAQLVGANYRHVFGIAGALAMATVAIAGFAFGTYSSFAPASGTIWLLFAFEAVVIGGLGSLWGTLLGGIVLGMAQAVGAAIDPTMGTLAGHLVFLGVLAVRPEGLLPARVTA